MCIRRIVAKAGMENDEDDDEVEDDDDDVEVEGELLGEHKREPTLFESANFFLKKFYSSLHLTLV